MVHCFAIESMVNNATQKRVNLSKALLHTRIVATISLNTSPVVYRVLLPPLMIWYIPPGGIGSIDNPAKRLIGEFKLVKVKLQGTWSCRVYASSSTSSSLSISRVNLLYGWSIVLERVASIDTVIYCHYRRCLKIPSCLPVFDMIRLFLRTKSSVCKHL